MSDELKPCPSCPDGNEWDSDGPTGRVCKTCKGFAFVKPNGAPLTEEQQADLKTLLEKYKSLFDGTLGNWKGEDYNIELRPDAMPYHAQAFPIPKVHEQTL